MIIFHLNIICKCFIHSLLLCINRLFKVLTLSSINYYAWKILNFILLNTMHMAMIHLRLLRKAAEEGLNHFYCFLQRLYSWRFIKTLFYAPVFLSTLSTPFSVSHQGPDVSIICNKCIAHPWIFPLLPPGHPSISHLCTFPWSPAKNSATIQVISSPLMQPICANKPGHAILSNSISRQLYLSWHQTPLMEPQYDPGNPTFLWALIFTTITILADCYFVTKKRIFCSSESVRYTLHTQYLLNNIQYTFSKLTQP